MSRYDSDQGYIYYVGWDHQGCRAYLYGSKLELFPDGWVSLENALVPAGAVLMTWDSKLNYQVSRMEPVLPVLQEKKEYIFRGVYSTPKPGTLLFRINYFNRQQEPIGEKIIRDNLEAFELPEGAFSYSVQMLQAGTDSFSFHHIEIFKREQKLYELQNVQAETDQLNLVLLEPCGNCSLLPAKKVLRKLPNLIVVPHLFTAEPEWQEQVMQIAGAETTKRNRARFWGYGPVSASVAKKAAKTWSFGEAEAVTDYERHEKKDEHSPEKQYVPMLIRRNENLQVMIENERQTEKIRKIPQ